MRAVHSNRMVNLIPNFIRFVHVRTDCVEKVRWLDSECLEAHVRAGRCANGEEVRHAPGWRNKHTKRDLPNRILGHQRPTVLDTALILQQPSDGSPSRGMAVEKPKSERNRKVQPVSTPHTSPEAATCAEFNTQRDHGFACGKTMINSVSENHWKLVTVVKAYVTCHYSYLPASVPTIPDRP